jgi:hypothetical protein
VTLDKGIFTTHIYYINLFTFLKYENKFLDLSITYNQKVALDKFKELVGPRLPHDYMSEDIYLIRWLRAKNFDIPAAEKMLKTVLIYNQNINSITNKFYYCRI